MTAPRPEARKLAGAIWAEPTHSHKVLDVDLAESIAVVLDALMVERDAAQQSRDAERTRYVMADAGWKEMDRQRLAAEAERDQLWRIVKGVHGALSDAHTVPVPALDADLYEAVMQIVRERDRATTRFLDLVWMKAWSQNT